MMNCLAEKLCCALLCLCTAACLPAADAYFTTFARGKWDPAMWVPVKSPRFSYLGDMVQLDDHIMNRTPELSDDEIFRKHAADVYSCLMLKRKFTGSAVISATMSFDHRMAPLIVIAPQIGKSADGRAEHREHYEVVLFDEGINIWRHLWKDGRPSWYKAAFLKTKFEPKKRHCLEVRLSCTKNGRILTVNCDGKTFGYRDDHLPESYYVGITACEGRNRFYDFSVTEK